MKDDAIEVKLVIKDLRERHTMSQSWIFFAAARPYYIVEPAVACVGYVELGQNQCPGALLESDFPVCPLFSLFRIITQLATGVYNENNRSNIKLAIIIRKSSTKGNSVLFNIAKLYIVLRSYAFNFT